MPERVRRVVEIYEAAEVRWYWLLPGAPDATSFAGREELIRWSGQRSRPNPHAAVQVVRRDDLAQ